MSKDYYKWEAIIFGVGSIAIMLMLLAVVAVSYHQAYGAWCSLDVCQ